MLYLINHFLFNKINLLLLFWYKKKSNRTALYLKILFNKSVRLNKKKILKTGKNKNSKNIIKISNIWPYIFKNKSRSEIFTSYVRMEPYILQRTSSRKWGSNEVRFFVFIGIFSSLFDKFIFVEYFKFAIISIFDLIVSPISKFFFNFFPLFSIFVDALDDF